jgi:hypothetical protein
MEETVDAESSFRSVHTEFASGSVVFHSLNLYRKSGNEKQKSPLRQNFGVAPAMTILHGFKRFRLRLVIHRTFWTFAANGPQKKKKARQMADVTGAQPDSAVQTAASRKNRYCAWMSP